MAKIYNSKKSINWKSDDLFNPDILDEFAAKDKEETKANEDYYRLLDDCKGKIFYCNETGNKLDCCYNHIIGMPEKNDAEYILFEYELDVIRAIEDGANVWVLKARGLGLTEIILRYLSGVCLTGRCKDKFIHIVTGQKEEKAAKLLKRLQRILRKKYPNIKFDAKWTELTLNGTVIEAFPTKALKDLRGDVDVKYIFVDEADFFDKTEQDELPFVIKSYEEKSNAKTIMVSTPNQPDGLFAQIKEGKAFANFFKPFEYSYKIGLDKIYDRAYIEKKKLEPEFEREYNLKFAGGVGNFFDRESIDACICGDEEYNPTIPNREAITLMADDTGYSDDSKFARIVCSWFNNKIYVMLSEQATKPLMTAQLQRDLDVRMQYYVDKILVDGSDPAYIYALKEKLHEWPVDYHLVAKENYNQMICEPVPFTKQQYEFLVHDKEVIESGALRIHESFVDLIIGLKSAYVEGTTYNKTKSANNDQVDALSMILNKFKAKTINVTGR